MLSGVMIGRAAFNCPWQFASADSLIFGDHHQQQQQQEQEEEEAPAAGADGGAPLPDLLTRRVVIERYVEYAEKAWKSEKAAIEEQAREELLAESGLDDPSAQALGHRVKPRVGALREALYQPLLHLFAPPEKEVEDQVAPAEEQKVEEILRLPEGARPRAALARAKEKAAVIGGEHG